MENLIFGFGIYLVILGLWLNAKDNLLFVLIKLPWIFGGGFLMFYSAKVLGWI